MGLGSLAKADVGRSIESASRSMQERIAGATRVLCRARCRGAHTSLPILGCLGCLPLCVGCAAEAIVANATPNGEDDLLALTLTSYDVS